MQDIHKEVHLRTQKLSVIRLLLDWNRARYPGDWPTVGPMLEFSIHDESQQRSPFRIAKDTDSTLIYLFQHRSRFAIARCLGFPPDKTWDANSGLSRHRCAPRIKADDLLLTLLPRSDVFRYV